MRSCHLTGDWSDVVGKFWSRVDVGEDDECWPWKFTNQQSEPRYGLFYLKSSGDGSGVIRSHQFVYMITHKTPIPEGMVVRHTCDFKPCCNPAHIIVGTKRDDVNDMVARGLHRKAERERKLIGRES